MKKIIPFLLACCFQSLLAQETYLDSSSFEVSLTDKTHFGIANINGSIKVVGIAGNVAKIKAVRTIRSVGTEGLSKGRNEVGIDTYSLDGHTYIYLKVPGLTFQVDDNGQGRYEGCWNGEAAKPLGYSYTYEFTLQVPEHIALQISTLNDGIINGRGLKGAIQATNINGDIFLHEVDQCTQIKSINGDIHVKHRVIPQIAAHFSSLNGDINLYFPASLAAEFALKSRNGQLLTDFSWEIRPAQTETIQESDGSTAYRIGTWNRIQIGRAGPHISVETLNGDIQILKRP